MLTRLNLSGCIALTSLVSKSINESLQTMSSSRLFQLSMHLKGNLFSLKDFLHLGGFVYLKYMTPGTIIIEIEELFRFFITHSHEQF